MAKKEKRFETIYTQGSMNTTFILVDRETGVHYLYNQSGYSGGLTPLLGADGKPIVQRID